MAIPIITKPAPYPGNSGSPFGARTTNVLTASQSLVLAEGTYWVLTSANDTVTLTYASGDSDTLLGKSTPGTVYADGTNVAILNDGTADSGSGSITYRLLP
ncbi:MAG: hypothetical protein ACREFX_04735 [Opitutaceae bacterium]